MSIGLSAPKQDYIVLAGVPSPGRATVVGAGSPRSWDERRGYGIDGASLVCTGNHLSHFSVLIDIWDQNGIPSPDWAAWQIFARGPLARPKAGVPVVGIGIGHPQINMAPLNIDAVVVEDVTQFVQNDTGLWTCEIKFIAWKPPLPLLARALVKIPNIPVVRPPAASALDLEIQAARARNDALAAGLKP